MYIEQVAGRLHIELRKIEGSLNEIYDDTTSAGSDEDDSISHNRELTVKVLLV